ncbi:MAG: MBL fold metallo-hydrolase [Syntrophomonadaceae bacterium]|nr:MBL fold metallo-hydrolase [Syntrophomonadaceae bacterium]
MKMHTITLGITNCYLVEAQDGYIMVDAGSQHRGKKFLRAIRQRGIRPEEIKLIVITHAHFDHVGSLAAIQGYCQCPIMMHPLEARLVEGAIVVIPPGANALGRVVSWMGEHNKILLGFPATKVEYLVEHEYDLRAFGVSGKVISTPGHTPGSLSVVLDDGRAMVGDLAMNQFFTQNYPVFAELPEKVYASWQLLIDHGVQQIYPAHGPAFSIERLTAVLASRK